MSLRYVYPQLAHVKEILVQIKTWIMNLICLNLCFNVKINFGAIHAVAIPTKAHTLLKI